MRSLGLVVIAASFLLSHSINASESFRFSGKIKCELSATFIVFDFDNKIRHIPIVDGKNILGIVSIGDVVNHIIEQYKNENKHLKDYVQL